MPQSQFFKDDTLTHRDVLGALIGCGITRQSVGDILIGDHFCDFFITAETAPFILETLQTAGRVNLKLSMVALTDVIVPEQKFVEIQDTVASPRLDSIIASGFRISRSAATEYILAGKAALDGLNCDKPDKTIEEGTKISVRGLGKIKLSHIGHITKKGRISVIICRYV